jgi:hypothetical protein
MYWKHDPFHRARIKVKVEYIRQVVSKQGITLPEGTTDEQIIETSRSHWIWSGRPPRPQHIVVSNPRRDRVGVAVRISSPLSGLFYLAVRLILNLTTNYNLVSRVGFEPTTCGLKGNLLT